MKLRKKQGGGLKIIFFIFLFLIFVTKYSFSSQILDYETEEFINDILGDIKKVNKIDKTINFKIINDDQINAFVDYNNVIHINSGLIHYAKDYVALLSVLSHEVGHIDLNHISSRKKKIDNIKKYRNLSLLSVIAGSAITQSPEILQSSILSSAAISNQYIVFTKDQEIEADLYALRTLNLLNINSDSTIDLLGAIEQKMMEKGFSKDQQRISTHPYFKERVKLINNYNNANNIKTKNINFDYNNRFNFIRAKFLGYSNNIDIIKNLNEPFRTYAKSIKYSRNGNLKMSLENLNKLIKNEIQNDFIIETKADILFSYGFTKEALKFYKKNLKYYPLNFYAQIRVFENINTEKLSKSDIIEIFDKNKDMLYKYYNNKNILIKYLKLSEQLNMYDWVNFFKFFLNINEIDRDILDEEISYFKKTNDKDLLKLISKVEESIL